MPNLDPKNINGRLYNQLDVLLTQLEQGEHITLKERTAAMLIATRMQYIFIGLRREKVGDNADAGSSVRKYSAAFQKNDPRRGKKTARSAGKSAAAAEPERDNWFEQSGDILADDDGDAA